MVSNDFCNACGTPVLDEAEFEATGGLCTACIATPHVAAASLTTLADRLSEEWQQAISGTPNDVTWSGLIAEVGALVAYTQRMPAEAPLRAMTHAEEGAEAASRG